MATTTGNINISVTTAKQTFLTSKSASLYTVAFDGTTPYWSTIYTPGTINSSTATIPLINSGKLYIIESNASLTDLQAKITKQSDLAVSNSTVSPNQFRYDSFEYALSPADQGGTPQGNLTSVNGFGFPMELKVAYSDSTTATVGYSVNAETLTGALSSAGAPLINFGSGALSGEFLYAGSPSTDSGGGYTKPTEFTGAHWTTYLSQLSTQLNSDPIRISGVFNGAHDASLEWHNQAFYSYIVSYDNATSTFILTPDGNSQVKGIIKVSSSVLANNIYAIDSSTSADIYQVVKGVETLYTSEFLGANDQWGAIFTQFLTGLDLGYLGQNGISPNPSVSSPINLNGNWNWSPIYAFGDNLSSGTVTPTFDSYSKVFFDNSNSYGSQYSDNAMSQYSSGGPLVNLFEIVNGANQTVNTNQITLTVFDDGETPTGYTQPTLYNYIAPGSGYATFASPADADIANFVINLGIPAGNPSGGDQNTAKNRLAETSWFANPERFALSYQYQTSTNNWSDASFVYASKGEPNELWSQWSLSDDGGRAPLTPGATQGAEGIGTILLNNILIGKSAGDITWHKINVYDMSKAEWQSTPLKTFNIYTTSDGTGKFFYTDGQLAIDGGATVSTGVGQTSGVTTTVNLLLGSGAFIDPVLLVPDAKQGASYATSGTAPSAPVVGHFNASDTFIAESGQTEMISPNATGRANNVVFGWTGYNPNATLDSSNLWTKYYTNKVSAQNSVEVTWSLASAKDHGTGGSTLTTADIDGKWVTEQLSLTPGQYLVSMTEYTEQDGSRVQFAQQSTQLTLTVDGSLDTILAMRDAYLIAQAEPIVVQADKGTLVNDTGSPTVASLFSGPAHGTLQFNNDGSFTYTPNQGFVGLDSFVYSAEKDIGGGVIEKSQAAVNLQVVPDIGLLANALEDYSTIGLTLFGYLEHGATQTLSDTYLAELQTYQAQGLSNQAAMYKLANSVGETSVARALFPFLANPTTDVASINTFLDKVYDVLFDRAPDDAGREYWIQDIQAAINRGDDIDSYVYIIMNGAQAPDMHHLTAKSIIANEQIFQQYQHNDSINDVNSALFLAGANQINLLDSMVTVYNDAIA